jgi:hypothetical protein
MLSISERDFRRFRVRLSAAIDVLRVVSIPERDFRRFRGFNNRLQKDGSEFQSLKGILEDFAAIHPEPA